MRGMVAEMRQIPLSVLRRAGELVSAQSRVPVSPGTLDEEGRVLLCAGACLASAGLRVLVSEEEGERFDHALLAQKSSVAIEDAFCRLGWHRKLGRARIIENDLLPDAERKDRLLALLARWQSEAAAAAAPDG